MGGSSPAVKESGGCEPVLYFSIASKMHVGEVHYELHERGTSNKSIQPVSTRLFSITIY